MTDSPRLIRQHRFAPQPGACEILFVRHGESAPFAEDSTFPLVDGHGDPPLAPEGHEQAELTAARLAESGERIAAIYVTTLQRTHQTAAPLAARLGLEPQVVADLREVFLGDWEGGELRRKVIDGDPIAREMLAVGRWDVIPGGEPNDQFQARVRRGVEHIAARHRDELVVAVVHGGVIGQVMAIAAGAVGFSFTGSDNASISHVVVTDERWIVRCYNDTSHLRDRFSTADEAEPLIGVRPTGHTF